MKQCVFYNTEKECVFCGTKSAPLSPLVPENLRPDWYPQEYICQNCIDEIADESCS